MAATSNDRETSDASPPPPSAAFADGEATALGAGLREAFRDVLEEPVPPMLGLLAAELERRLAGLAPSTPAEPPEGDDAGA
jgi:hypothetical protein